MLADQLRNAYMWYVNMLHIVKLVLQHYMHGINTSNIKE